MAGQVLPLFQQKPLGRLREISPVNGVPDQPALRDTKGEDDDHRENESPCPACGLFVRQTVHERGGDQQRKGGVERIQVPRQFRAHQRRHQERDGEPDAYDQLEMVIAPPERQPRTDPCPRKRKQAARDDRREQPVELISLQHVQVIERRALVSFNHLRAARHEVVEEQRAEKLPLIELPPLPHPRRHR